MSTCPSIVHVLNNIVQYMCTPQVMTGMVLLMGHVLYAVSFHYTSVHVNALFKSICSILIWRFTAYEIEKKLNIHILWYPSYNFPAPLYKKSSF